MCGLGRLNHERPKTLRHKIPRTHIGRLLVPWCLSG